MPGKAKFFVTSRCAKIRQCTVWMKRHQPPRTCPRASQDNEFQVSIDSMGNVVAPSRSPAAAVVAGSGGGGGSGGGPSSPPPPTGNPTQFGTLTIAQPNADIVGLAVGFAEGILAIAQTAANEVVIFSSPSGVASRDCNNGGTATITNIDADTSFSVTAGDSLTIDYDECFGDLVDGDMDWHS